MSRFKKKLVKEWKKCGGLRGESSDRDLSYDTDIRQQVSKELRESPVNPKDPSVSAWYAFNSD